MNNQSKSSTWAGDLGLSVPIVCAPMGGVAGGRLAAAVSQAGALGMIGMGSAGSASALRRELAAYEDAVEKQQEPWGIGMVAWGIERDPVMLDAALQANPTVVSVSFGDFAADPHPRWVSEAHAAGVQTICQIATADEARRAADAGVDVVVARGKEAGGHGEHIEPRERLLEAVLDAVCIPVLTAGAIRTAEQVAGALAAGAAGAWIGTAFQACTEALTDERAKHMLFRAIGADTVVSRVMDVALDRPWPESIPERLLRTEFVDRWQGREAELARDERAKAEFRDAVEAGDYTVVPLDAGEGVADLVSEHTAAEVVFTLSAKLRNLPDSKR